MNDSDRRAIAAAQIAEQHYREAASQLQSLNERYVDEARRLADVMAQTRSNFQYLDSQVQARNQLTALDAPDTIRDVMEAHMRDHLDVDDLLRQGLPQNYLQALENAQQTALSRSSLFAASLSALDFYVIKEEKKWLEHRIAEEVSEAFGYVGFVPSPYVSAELQHEVVRARKAHLSRRAIQSLVMEHYDRQRCRELGKAVGRMLANPLFEGRGAVLRQTLQAHRTTKLDAMTTYSLAALIEGITMPLMYDLWSDWEVDAPKSKPKRPTHKHIPEMIEEAIKVINYSVDIQGAWPLIEYMEHHLFAKFYVDDPRGVSRTGAELNRHALLHGYALRGSRLNALRCFLMLDLLGILIPYIRRELFEVAHEP
jgi:hypothetical protein